METRRIKTVFVTLLTSYLISGLLILALAFALYRLQLKEAQVTYMVYLIYAISCMAGGFICGKSIRRQRFLWGMLLGLCYDAVLLAASQLLHAGGGMTLPQIAVNLALCVVSGAAGGMCS